LVDRLRDFNDRGALFCPICRHNLAKEWSFHEKEKQIKEEKAKKNKI
jgi:uncharacterized Zn finger protein (UPF0148 family)